MPEGYISSEMRGKYRNEKTPKDEVSQIGGGIIPEDYRGPTKRGTSDYPKSTEGFVPVEEISDEGLNPEEALIRKEEEDQEVDTESSQMWDELMDEEDDNEEGDGGSVQEVVRVAHGDVVPDEMEIEEINRRMRAKKEKIEKITGKARGTGERPAQKPAAKKPGRRNIAA